jgi:hypothetical protein
MCLILSSGERETVRSGIGPASLLIFSCLIGGCLAGSDEAPPPDTAHDPGYRFLHSKDADEDLFFCQLCHGEDFDGTPLVLSCFACHPSPAPPFVMHPPSLEPTHPWRFPVNHGSEAKKDIQGCQGCHGQKGGPGSNPSFAVPIGNLERGCESAEGCHFNGPFDNGHNPGTAHPALDPDDSGKQDLMHWYGERIPFVDGSGRQQIYLISHYNAGNLESACTLCHGAALGGGAGPACTDCHIIDAVADPTGCVSCHGTPVGPPADLIDEVGRREELEGNPVYRTFTEEVSRGFHLEHDTIACRDRDSTEDCRSCHGATFNVDKHHDLVGDTIPEDTDAPFGTPGDEYECLSCHEVFFNPITQDFEFKVERDCIACHAHPFPAELPCPE